MIAMLRDDRNITAAVAVEAMAMVVVKRDPQERRQLQAKRWRF